VVPTGNWTILAGPSSADADLKSVNLRVTGHRTAGVEVVSAQPDATELSLDTPDNRINAQLSVTKHDMTFWDLSDWALKVKYTSSDPSIATVDASGSVKPVSTGTVLITAKATANGESKSTTFPVVVTSGAPDATGSAFPNAYTSRVNFGDRAVRLDQAYLGVQLSASVFPANPTATYSYQIAPMDTNTAGASVTATGVLTAARTGHVRVTVTATSAGVQTSESALVRITPRCRFGGVRPSLAGDGSDVVKAGRAVPVEFALTSADGKTVTDAQPRLYLVKKADGVNGNRVPATPVQKKADNTAPYSAGKAQYIFSWDTTGLAPGAYELQIDWGNGSVHAIALTIS